MLRHPIWLLGMKSPAREVRLRANRSIDWFRRCDLPYFPTLVLQADLLLHVLIEVLIATLKVPMT